MDLSKNASPAAAARDPEPDSASFLPDFCSSRMVFVVVLLAELLAIALALARPGSAEQELLSFSMLSLLAQWVALPCLGALCLLQPALNRLPEPWLAAGSFGAVLIMTLLVTELSWWLAVNWMPPPVPDAANHGGFLVRSIGVSGIAWALALRYFYVQHQWRRRIESEADTRFQALQSRIRPHFLFNCMNTIAGLTHNRPDLAEQAIEDLADLIRASLREADRPATLSDELSLCERYLRIEKHRLGDRLQVEWGNFDAVPNLQLPPLILQPLLENAIYHGIEPLTGGGTIRIGRELSSSAVMITITNPTPADGEPVAGYKGNRLAQENVAQRLSAFFGRPNLLRISASPGEYRVTLVIPVNHEVSDR